MQSFFIEMHHSWICSKNNNKNNKNQKPNKQKNKLGPPAEKQSRLYRYHKFDIS